MFVLSKWQFRNLFGALSYWYLFCDPRRWDNSRKVRAPRRVSASGAPHIVTGQNKHGHNNSAPLKGGLHSPSHGLKLAWNSLKYTLPHTMDKCSLKVVPILPAQGFIELGWSSWKFLLLPDTMDKCSLKVVPILPAQGSIAIQSSFWRPVYQE